MTKIIALPVPAKSHLLESLDLLKQLNMSAHIVFKCYCIFSFVWRNPIHFYNMKKPNISGNYLTVYSSINTQFSTLPMFISLTLTTPHALKELKLSIIRSTFLFSTFLTFYFSLSEIVTRTVWLVWPKQSVIAIFRKLYVAITLLFGNINIDWEILPSKMFHDSIFL